MSLPLLFVILYLRRVDDLTAFVSVSSRKIFDVGTLRWYIFYKDIQRKDSIEVSDHSFILVDLPGGYRWGSYGRQFSYKDLGFLKLIP
jgi:hypothetical protein